ncbi:MAG: hypothetical protein V2A54_06120 [Bacteroidota bacterium]
MKAKSILFVILIIFACCSQQFLLGCKTAYKKIVVEQAETMGQFLLKKDYKSFFKFTHPKIAEMAGGQEKLSEAMEKGMEDMDSKGMAFINLEFGKPSKIISCLNELQCTLSETITMKVPNGVFLMKSTLIAISIDDGKNWYFFDTSKSNIKQIKELFPNLSDKIKLPKAQNPVFIDAK